MIILTRTNINVWDLAAGTSVYSWDGHGDWVQVICVGGNNVDDDEIFLVEKVYFEIHFQFLYLQSKTNVLSVGNKNCKLKILNQEITVNAQPIRFQ